ncbi:MAG TPA: hypothetical protein DCR55_07805 [Lentisphaeria bacterium]|nr:hypothetical protein [Lentisphaeria bacterium]
MNSPLLPTLALLLASTLSVSSEPTLKNAIEPMFSPERYNVVWASPSKDEHGSTPLGNGSTGLNAWIEPNGDLVFYISRTDSWGDNGRLLKVGRVRITLNPAPATDDFLQTLSLVDGTLKARCGETEIRLWADANHSVIHAEIDGPKDTEATAAIELWRTEQVSIPSSWECSDVHLFRPRPGEKWGNLGPTVMEPDNLLHNQEGRIGWYHRNIKSVGPAMHAKIQGMADFERLDPLLHRTFGAIIKADNAKRLDDTHLLSSRAKSHRFDLYVHTEHPATEAEWLAATEQVIAETQAVPLAKRRADHEAWWQAFWQRSWIHATSGSEELAKATSLVPSNTLNVRFGINPNGGNKFTGQFGPSTILTRALSADEIQQRAKTRSDRATTDSSEVLFSGTPANHSELQNSARWTDATSLTAELWIHPDSLTESVRLLDKTMPGSDDGLLLDTHPKNSLRLIVGAQQLNASGCLKANQWQHVVAVLNGATGQARLFLDGQQVAGPKDDKPASDAFVLSRAYALQRYINACAGRGAYPIKFNGSIFTVDGIENDKSRGPDYRRWGPGYWWQNTRLPYISMLTSGDVEMTDPLYKMYCQDLFEYHKYRTRRHTGHGGIYVPECMYFWGEMFAETYGETPFEEREDKLQDNRYHKWEWVSGLEMSFMMLDRYEHTLDEAFLKDTTIPFATEILTFFVEHYDVDKNGKLVMHPAQALETWWECTNPMDPVAGMHAVTNRLLGLPEHLTTAAMRAYWTQVQAKLPDLPTREHKGETIFAPAEAFAMCKNGEVPELYCVFPFRLSSFEKPNAEMGRRTLHHRTARGNNGWRQDEIFMAYLGLADEARENLVGRARNHHKGSRFPAFWGPNMDWIPDQDHGGVLMKAFQAMLLQTEGKKIYLRPAWPKDWNVKFRLHAPYKTVIEGRVQDGKIVDLAVTPTSRAKDVVVTQ